MELAGIYGRKISVFADQMQFRIIRTYLQMKFIFISFYNYEFYKQWNVLKEYANQKGYSD